MNCTPSARHTEHMADSDSEYAAEGTEAHSLAEYKLRTALGESPEDPRATLRFLDNEMETLTDEYVQFILEIIGQSENPVVRIEERLDFSRWVPEGFGTSDCIIIAGNTLHVVDFKYGKREVTAEYNPQMGLYALGALDLFDYLYGIRDVQTTIYQPRIKNYSTSAESARELYRWGDEVVKPLAQAAWKGAGDFKAGKWCSFCKAKQRCRAFADYHMELARLAFADPATLDDSEIAEILGKIDSLVSWAEMVKKYAFAEALKGRHWTGYKLVSGKSRRAFTDENRAAEILRKNGYTEIYKNELLGFTALDKLVGGTKALNKLLAEVIHTPPGKPALVPESDKREPINVMTAEDVFSPLEN